MKKTNFDRLLQHYMEGTLPERERQRVDAWLNVVKTRYEGELELSKEQEDRLYERIVSGRGTLEEVTSFDPQAPEVKLRPRVLWYGWAAAGVLLAAVSMILWTTLNRSDWKTYQASDKPTNIQLPDGSLVWLQPGTRLDYHYSATVREGRLSGKALFEIAKDSLIPFTIACEAAQVTVKGTSFYLATRPDHVQLALLTGKVLLTTETSQTAVVPNEQVTFFTDGRVQRIPLSRQDRAQVISGTTYDMAFQDATMEDILNRLQQKFGVKIQVTSSHLYRCRLTADFTDRSMKETLQLIAVLLNLEYTISGRTILLQGQGCSSSLKS